MNYLASKRIPNAEAFLVHCEGIKMKSRSVVFRQGERSEDLYLILDGSVSVIVDDTEDPKQEMVVSYLNPDELFGEMGVVSDQSRMATAATVTDCDLLFVSREEFDKMVDESHIVVRGILRILAERLRSAQMPKK